MKHFLFGPLMKAILLSTVQFITISTPAKAFPMRDFANSTSSTSATEAFGRKFSPGEKAINVYRDPLLVTVVGTESGGTYALRFEEGPHKGQIGGNWSASDLAKMIGCGPKYICVGEEGFAFRENTTDSARVIAIQDNSKFVIQFNSVNSLGDREKDWEHKNFARKNGCGDRFCVGEIALNKERNYVRVKIVGITSKKLLAIEFLEGSLIGQIGGRWDEDSLVSIRPAQFDIMEDSRSDDASKTCRPNPEQDHTADHPFYLRSQDCQP